MANILCLETATKNCSVAIAKNGALIALVEESADQFIHAEKLHVFVKAALAQASIKVSELGAVAVSNGPGSYTGLRIGISAAKGFCFAQNIPLVAINTTEVLAQKVVALNADEKILAALDARRNEIYAQWFDAKKCALSEVSAEIVDENSFENFKDSPVVIVGDGAQKTAEFWANKNCRVFQELPSAQNMVSLAQQKYDLQDFVDVAYHEPFYLKDFVAGKPKKLL